MSKNIIILAVCVVILIFTGLRNSHCMGGDRDMKMVDLVDKFNLTKIDKITVETDKNNPEKIPYINKIVTDKETIITILNSLKRNSDTRTIIKALTHYIMTFYKEGKIILNLYVNDWPEGGFIRIGYKDAQSDLLPDKSFFEAFHKIIK